MKRILLIILPILILIGIITDINKKELNPMDIKQSLIDLEFIQFDPIEINFGITDYYKKMKGEVEKEKSGNNWLNGGTRDKTKQFDFWGTMFDVFTDTWDALWGVQVNLFANLFDWIKQIGIIIYDIGYFIYWIVGNTSIMLGWFASIVY